MQIDKLLKSKARKVVILWDEGAEVLAHEVCTTLRKKGLPATYCRITGQPDDHSIEYLRDLVSEARDTERVWV